MVQAARHKREYVLELAKVVMVMAECKMSPRPPQTAFLLRIQSLVEYKQIEMYQTSGRCCFNRSRCTSICG